MSNEIVRRASPLNTVSAMLTVRELLSACQPLDLNGVKERTLELVIANTRSGSTGEALRSGFDTNYVAKREWDSC